jgi:hypothetical protein
VPRVQFAGGFKLGDWQRRARQVCEHRQLDGGVLRPQWDEQLQDGRSGAPHEMGAVGERRELAWWQAVSLRERHEGGPLRDDVAPQAAERREVRCLRQEPHVRASISSIMQVNYLLRAILPQVNQFAGVVDWPSAIPREWSPSAE